MCTHRYMRLGIHTDARLRLCMWTHRHMFSCVLTDAVHTDACVVWTHRRMCPCVRAETCVCVYTPTNVSVCAHRHTCLCAQTDACVCVCAHRCPFAQAETCICTNTRTHMLVCKHGRMCPASCGQQSLVPLTNCSPSLTYVRTYVCTYVPMQQNVVARCKCIQTYDAARCTKYACVLASIRLQMNIRLPCRCLPFNIMT
jgi:hypothetical protein